MWFNIIKKGFLSANSEIVEFFSKNVFPIVLLLLAGAIVLGIIVGGTIGIFQLAGMLFGSRNLALLFSVFASISYSLLVVGYSIVLASKIEDEYNKLQKEKAEIHRRLSE